MKLILALNMREASQYAQLAGLTPHSWRLVGSTADFAGRHNLDLVELPGWQRAPRRFTVESALRYSRHERLVVTEADLDELREAAKPAPVESQWRGIGEQLAMFGEELAAYNREEREVRDPQTPMKPAKKTVKKPVDAKPERVLTPTQTAEFF